MYLRLVLFQIQKFHVSPSISRGDSFPKNPGPVIPSRER
jgi:hypothetical protein